jgi:hypothetical protein
MNKQSVERKLKVEKILGTKLSATEYHALKHKFYVFWQSPYKILAKGKIEYTYNKCKESYTLQDIKDWLKEFRA